MCPYIFFHYSLYFIKFIIIFTEEHFVVICGDPPEKIFIIFEAEVNPIKNFIKIVIDTDLHALEEANYEKIR